MEAKQQQGKENNRFGQLTSYLRAKQRTGAHRLGHVSRINSQNDLSLLNGLPDAGLLVKPVLMNCMLRGLESRHLEVKEGEGAGGERSKEGRKEVVDGGRERECEGVLLS